MLKRLRRCRENLKLRSLPRLHGSDDNINEFINLAYGKRQVAITETGLVVVEAVVRELVSEVWRAKFRQFHVFCGD